MKLFYLALAMCSPLQAGPRTSASYNLASDSNNSAGLRCTSANYINDGSAGGITGISTVTSPAETDKAGYLAQLVDPVGLNITSPAATVSETSTLQLGATLLLDDATTDVLSPGSVTWGIGTAPITGVSNSGLLTTGDIYQDTAATQQGSYSGFTNFLALTVINTLPDNFGTYAGDGLPDDWQVQYFGIGNPNAGPAVDADGDSYNNFFEYNAFLIPTDPLSTFSIKVVDMPGNGHGVMFSPRFAGCTYDLQGSGDLLLWDHVLGTITDSGRIRTIADPLGNAPRRFYRVAVHRP